jgi:hypothetical protein
VHQVGHLPELYEDARSEKDIKIMMNVLFLLLLLLLLNAAAEWLLTLLCRLKVPSSHLSQEIIFFPRA